MYLCMIMNEKIKNIQTNDVSSLVQKINEQLSK
ncbi:hypothetical protein BASH2_01341 [Bacillus anthracis]|nr:hypothetical protein BASH2_01341 [Bacillus anthracis]